MAEEPRMPEQKESIKLSKMSKGYNWEIKVLGWEGNLYKITDAEVKRLKELNEDMKKEYGEKE